MLKRILTAVLVSSLYLTLAAAAVYTLQASMDEQVPPTLFQQPYFLAINLCVALGILTTLVAFTRSRAAAVLIYSALMGTLVLVNVIKLRQTDEPFIPTDLLRLTSFRFLLRYLSPGALLFLGLMAILCVLSCRVLIAARASRGPSPVRAARVFFLSLVLFIPPVWQAFPWDNDTFDPHFYYWYPRQNAVLHGFFESSLQFGRYLSVKRPSWYNPSHLRAKLDSFATGEHPASLPTESVVILLVEAFWDPTLAGVPFKRDPIPNFRKFFEENLTWHVVSNVYGGNTTNTSFEVLTGFSTAYIPENANLFQQYLKREIGGLPWLFRHQGYRTSFFHNNEPSFWNRDQVLPLLGFERSVWRETLMHDNPKAKITDSDRPLFDALLEELKSTDEKQFIEAATMATHSPYVFEIEPELQAEFLDPSDSIKHVNLLVFASKLSRTDAEFGRFREQLRALGKPVRLVVYGDHQPMASLPYMDKQLREEGYYPKFEVTFGLERRTEDLASYSYKNQHVSFNCLTPILAKSFGLPHDPVLSYVNELCDRQPMVTRALIAKQASPALAEQAELLYDSVFGQRVVQAFQEFTVDQQKIAASTNSNETLQSVSEPAL